MIIQLPFSNYPNQQFEIQLGSATYQFNARWNDRGSFWTFDMIAVATGKTLVQGIPMLLGCDMLNPFSLGIGMLITYDETGNNTDATIDSLGVTTNVYWISPDENLAADLAAVS